ncbi:replicative DNA helicase (plasmid) [Kitasatospora sp. NBC_00315]
MSVPSQKTTAPDTPADPEPAFEEHDWSGEPPTDTDAPAPPVPAARRPKGRKATRTNSAPDDADRDETFERVPPQDLGAEQSVLGGMLLSKNAITDVIEVLKPTDYYRPAHELIHNAILGLYGRGEPADPITVAAELTKRGELVRVGGPGYLHTLVNSVPTAANAEYYAEIVHERAVLRRLVEAGTRIAGMGYAAEGDVDQIVNAAQAEIFNIADQQADDGGSLLMDGMDDTIQEVQDRQAGKVAISGIPTGFADLDALTHGLHPGQFIVVAARPAMGKTTLATDVLRSACIANNYRAVMFSLEMGRKELQLRMISAEGRVPLSHLRAGTTMTDDDWAGSARALSRMTDAQLRIDDNPGQTALGISAKCRKIKQKHGLDLVVIDYLQLLQLGGRRPETRQQEVSDISRTLKLLAKELEVPVIALSQLNRGPEQRTDKKPVVSDLRESGSIEQDADIVILLHREDAYEKESKRAGEADFIIGKHRNGPTATVTVAFQGHWSRFVDMTRDPEPDHGRTYGPGSSPHHSEDPSIDEYSDWTPSTLAEDLGL